MPPSTPGAPTSTEVRDQDLSTLEQIENRLLWLATATVDHANRVRPNPGGVKVGGHQASSASMVSIMTALWFRHLRANDRVSVKPHASPVLHAINRLLGRLDPSYLASLRALGGLQSYPSRSKDPDPVDYSTGSVGIGATATVWGSIARRYVEGAFGGAGTGRQYALVGDAELDEGAIWEALLEPSVPELGELVWIVDLNRQSLDRVLPRVAIGRFDAMFAAAGWQVLTVKYGRLLDEIFEREGGATLRQRIDDMSNPEYQRLLRCAPSELRERLPGSETDAPHIERLIADIDDDTLLSAIRNLGGHDLEALDTAFAAIDDSRPTVIFAYTIKGYGLPVEGHPQNHSSLLNESQMNALAERLGVDPAHPWDTFPDDSAAMTYCAHIAERLRRPSTRPAPKLPVPSDFGRTPRGTSSTQAALGRALLDLTREAPDVAARVVTLSPDVSSSTNLGGWVNKVGVWSTQERINWFADDPESVLHWRERPSGQHIELGIAEVNLVSLLGELGATWERWGEPLLPIGVLYDPFVGRALEPWSFGIYGGGQSVLVGTPSGVSLAPEGGAHQSVITPSIGLEQPGCVSYEPAFAADVEWCLLAGLAQIGVSDGHSTYLRLSTRPVDQLLAGIPGDPVARERRRQHAVGGGFVLRRPDDAAVAIVAMGAVVPEALVAADRLEALGRSAEVICVTSPDLLYRALQVRQGRRTGSDWILDQLFPRNRVRPLVTVLDGHPHTLSFLASITQSPHTALGVTEFGQSGSLPDVYRHHEIDSDSIVRASLDLVDSVAPKLHPKPPSGNQNRSSVEQETQ